METTRSLRARGLSRAQHAASLLLLAIIAIGGGDCLLADTLFQTGARGKQNIVHRDAIIVKADDSAIIYKHFELKDRRIVKVRLSRGAKGYSYKTSSLEDRRQIVDKWRRFAYTGTITDTSGKVTQLFGLYLDFYPPEGRGSLLESIPARTTFPVLIEGGSADEIDFSKLSRIEVQGDRLTLTLTGGEVKQARFLMPTDQPAEARFLGITDQYDPASEDVFDFAIPLAKLKEIRFE